MAKYIRTVVVVSMLSFAKISSIWTGRTEKTRRNLCDDEDNSSNATQHMRNKYERCVFVWSACAVAAVNQYVFRAIAEESGNQVNLWHDGKLAIISLTMHQIGAPTLPSFFCTRFTFYKFVTSGYAPFFHSTFDNYWTIFIALKITNYAFFSGRPMPLFGSLHIAINLRWSTPVLQHTVALSLTIRFRFGCIRCMHSHETRKLYNCPFSNFWTFQFSAKEIYELQQPHKWQTTEVDIAC